MSLNNNGFSFGSYAPETASERMTMKTRVAIPEPNHRFHTVLKSQVPSVNQELAKERAAHKLHKRSPATAHNEIFLETCYSTSSSLTLTNENSHLRSNRSDICKLKSSSPTWKPLKISRRAVLRDLNLNSPRVISRPPTQVLPRPVPPFVNSKSHWRRKKSNSLGSSESLNACLENGSPIARPERTRNTLNNMDDLNWIEGDSFVPLTDHPKRHGIYRFPPMEELPKSESQTCSESSQEALADLSDTIKDAFGDVSLPDFEDAKINFTSSTPIHSQPSLPSLYSQDDHCSPVTPLSGIKAQKATTFLYLEPPLSRPVATSRDPPPISRSERIESKHHEIIQSLLDEVDQVLLQWATLYNKD